MYVGCTQLTPQNLTISLGFCVPPLHTSPQGWGLMLMTVAGRRNYGAASRTGTGTVNYGVASRMGTGNVNYGAASRTGAGTVLYNAMEKISRRQRDTVRLHYIPNPAEYMHIP